ncbi:PP0621 family protein [Sulfurovum sp.]|uniref:PP0621 family protein n=1 Tax=Sulfurovum sp. TaxID=1969726 RepID=UPI002867BF24|nr:PP0621 family protein [Sulfurovum sp.]
MILKLLFFAIVALLIYKLFGGRFPKIGKTPDEKKLDDDTLVECAKCHTYVTVKESIIVGGKYYCSRECTL